MLYSIKVKLWLSTYLYKGHPPTWWMIVISDLYLLFAIIWLVLPNHQSIHDHYEDLVLVLSPIALQLPHVHAIRSFHVYVLSIFKGSPRIVIHLMIAIWTITYPIVFLIPIGTSSGTVMQWYLFQYPPSLFIAFLMLLIPWLHDNWLHCASYST